MMTYMKIGYMNIRVAPARTKNGEYFRKMLLFLISFTRMMDSEDLAAF